MNDIATEWCFQQQTANNKHLRSRAVTVFRLQYRWHELSNVNVALQFRAVDANCQPPAVEWWASRQHSLYKTNCHRLPKWHQYLLMFGFLFLVLIRRARANEKNTSQTSNADHSLCCLPSSTHTQFLLVRRPFRKKKFYNSNDIVHSIETKQFIGEAFDSVFDFCATIYFRSAQDGLCRK